MTDANTRIAHFTMHALHRDLQKSLEGDFSEANINQIHIRLRRQMKLISNAYPCLDARHKCICSNSKSEAEAMILMASHDILLAAVSTISLEHSLPICFAFTLVHQYMHNT